MFINSREIHDASWCLCLAESRAHRLHDITNLCVASVTGLSQSNGRLIAARSIVYTRHYTVMGLTSRPNEELQNIFRIVQDIASLTNCFQSTSSSTAPL